MFEKIAERFTKAACTAFGGRLTGVYLHGSAAMGCFNPEKSDLDFLVVTESDPSDEEKRAFLQEVVPLSREGPAKGIEWSIITKDVCRPFVYPTPFSLHFSVAHLAWYEKDPEAYIAGMNGTDRDLAAHVTVLLHRGKTLCGKPLFSVFAPVSREDYVDSIWLDIENAKEDILSDPVYITLNLCRVLAFLEEGLVLSKKEGGEWGIDHLPEHFLPLVKEALLCYESDHTMSVNSASALSFAGWALAEIELIR